MLLSSASGVDSVVQFITVLVIFVLVLALTLCVTKWVAGYQKTQMVGKNMEVIETLRLPPDKYVQIVRVGKHYLAVAVSKEQVTLLAQLDKDELEDVTDVSSDMSFSKVFDRFKKEVSQNGNDSIGDIHNDHEDIK